MRDAPPGPGGIISYFTRHRTLANLVMVLMLVSGLAAATRLRAQFFPDVVQSEITVSVAWPGAGAEDVDRGIVGVLEPAMLAVDGVADVTSHASEGRAALALEFEPGRDLNLAVEDVTAAVEAITTLPEDAETPEVARAAWRDQVTEVVITGPVGLDQLGRFADELVTRLFAAGVTRTTVRGLADPRITVEVPSVALMRHDLTMADIATAIAAASGSTPAGEIGTAGARVRTGEDRRSAAAVAAVVLRSGADGARLTVGDVATVRAEPADRGRASFVGANPAVILRVDRTATGDAIRMQADVERVVAEMQPLLPPGVTVGLVRARAEVIAGRLTLLIDDAIYGLLGVVAMLFLFLNARTAFWVASGIPIAMLAGLAVMYAFGLTLNMISLFALMLILGVLVDDAIVVSEHAVSRTRVLKEHPVVAAENAARRMALPVLGSTITMVIAFSGLVVIGGRFGELIADIPFTVIAVLLVSLVECFLILPNHMVHALASEAEEKWYDGPSRQMNRGFDWVAERLVRPFARFVVQARYMVIAGFVFLLALQAAAFIRGDVTFRFFDAPEQSSINGNFAMLPGATRDDTMEMLREVQRATDTVAATFAGEHGTNPVTFAMAEVGGGSGRGLASAATRDADLLGGMSIELVDSDQRPYPASAFIAALQAEVRPHPLLEELSFRGAHFGPGGSALSVDLFGAEAEVLKAAAEAVKAGLAAFPEVSALEDTLAYDKEELVLTLTPQGQALGFAVDALGRGLRERLTGIEAATFPEGARTATIRVELPPGEMTADFLDSTLLRAGPGVFVPLSDIVKVATRTGFSAIRRENGLRTVTVSGDVAADNPDRATEVSRALREDILPAVERDFGVASQLSGQAAQESEFLSDALVGFILCLIGIYLVLAWIFASWSRPLVVMSVIPFGMIGAVWGHDIWNTPMSMFSIVGLIGMVGIIINDSIVLVSTVDEYLPTRSPRAAIVDAVVDRLKPVFLTTTTTVIGFAPLLYESSSQAVFLKPTVITLAYGLGFGMVLVLVLVPAIMAVQADAARVRAAFRRMLRRRARTARLRGVLVAAVSAVAGVFAATVGTVAVTGALPGWIAGPAPMLAAFPALAATAMFIGGTVAVLLVALAAAWLVRRPAQPPGQPLISTT